MKLSFKKIQLTEVKEFGRKLPWLMAEHIFLAAIVLVLLSLLVGALLFYQYQILVQKTAPEVKTEIIGFQENLYQEVLTEWQEREERFEQAQTKEYPDPF